jgi:[ribosomal protein S5]-alanine N-acetyltransferase
MDQVYGQAPRLMTKHLLLRPFAMADCPAVAELCGDGAIARTTLVIPHPYQLSDAEKWIITHPQAFADGRQANWAITVRADDEPGPGSGALVGAIGLFIKREHLSAELGYWIGKPYWGRGYATEAARAVVRFGFESLGLNRIHAHHFAENPASGRVLEKIGMQREGLARQVVIKDGVPRDCPLYSILRCDFEVVSG